jgi:hypothetical protein
MPKPAETQKRNSGVMRVGPIEVGVVGAVLAGVAESSQVSWNASGLNRRILQRSIWFIEKDALDDSGDLFIQGGRRKVAFNGFYGYFSTSLSYRARPQTND